MVTLQWKDEDGNKHRLEYDGPVPAAGVRVQLYAFNAKYLGALQASAQTWQLRQRTVDKYTSLQWEMNATVDCIWIAPDETVREGG